MSKTTFFAVLVGVVSFAGMAHALILPCCADSDTVYLLQLNRTTGSYFAVNIGTSGLDGITTDDSGSTVTDVLAGEGELFARSASLSRYRAIGVDANGIGIFSTGGSDRFNLSELLGANNAFTLEALLKPNTTDLSSHGEIWCAEGRIPTIRGEVAITCENSDNSFQLQVEIRGNMTARDEIPTKGHLNATVLVERAVVEVMEEGGCLVLENVSTGTHAIWLSDAVPPDEAKLKANWKAGMSVESATNSAAGELFLVDDSLTENLTAFYRVGVELPW